ncbi:MAG: Crp/Fnr family transcriptional regulator [Gammaproteobacteria bacterium]|nr:Crp/Fnr family transcriptional regulator [Gammaproteobacteria bacterium]MDH5736163.1 Crp/Fnr family transcriptional regulator [Gammaproteobacteria bacterium]
MHETLKHTPLFVSLPNDELEKLATKTNTKTYKKNTVVVSKDDHTDSLYIILEGNIKIYLDDEQGKEVIINIMSAGEYFGELALISGKPRSANVMAMAPCKLAIISKADFMECLTNNPSLSFNIIQALIDQVHNLTENISSLALLDVYGRIVQTLNKNAVEKDGKRMTNPMTHQDIANMIGSSREMVSKILKDLRVGGYITTDGKSIIIERTLPTGW